MADDDIRLGVSFDADEQDANREFDRVARQFQRAMEDVAPQVGRAIGDSLARSLRNTQRNSRVFDELAEGARDVARATTTASRGIEEMTADVAALDRRVSATRKTLTQLGADPDLFAVIDNELKRVTSTVRAFNQDLERVADNPDLLRGYEVSFKNAQQTIFREIAGIQSQLRNLSDIQRQEGQRAVQAADRADQLRLEQERSARARFVVEAQREGSLTLAADRASSQQRLAAQRQFQRTRLELLRFSVNQIRALERGLAAVFRGTATVVSGAYARIEGTVLRIGRIFRRSNADLNDGLRGALLQRERTIDRSFDRQTRDIRTATIEQSRAIQRLEAQASRGVTGALTGRSSVGALVGGGLAFGGGFLLIDKLREGFDESVNLNESLNKTRQIFGDAADDVISFADNSVEALFVTSSAALEAAANFGIFGKAAGLTGADLSGFSKRLTVLATDLASFNNTEVDQAVVAISAALRGEQEPIRNYGVLLNEAVLQERAFADGVTEIVRKLTPAERVLAAYSEILAQTVDQQGDAARTADDFANSSRRAAAAATTTFAAIAENLVPIAERITNFAFPALNTLTAFIRDETGPVLSVVRAGLIGAGTALSALLAAKVAGEAIQFLGIALRAVATPLGAFITAVAAIGAAINILRQRSPEFRIAVTQIGEAVKAVFGAGFRLAADAVRTLADVITDRVVPVVVRLIEIVRGALRRAFEVGFEFLIERVVPALERFARFITGTAVPAVIDLANAIIDRVRPAFAALRDLGSEVLGVILPLIGPAVTGFQNLGSAIRDVLGGDFSGIVSGLRDVGTGLVATFANVGTLIYDALRPQIERAVQFVTSAFSNIDITSVAKTFLNIVETIGRILGTIVSDPRFVLALEAIVAAAVITGVRFIQGFTEGVISNLPDLVDLFGGQLRTALGAALSNALDPGFIARAIVGAFAAISIGSALFGVLRRPVDDAGKRVGAGFVQSFATRVRSGVGRNSFAAGFFGGFGGLERAAEREGQAALRAMSRQQARAADTLRVLSGGTRGIGTAFVGSDGIRREINRVGDDAVKNLEKLRETFGPAEIAGAEFRARLGAVFRDVGTFATGARVAISGNIRDGFAIAGSAARSFAGNLAGLLRSTVSNLRAVGVAVGQAVGGAIVSGVGAALAGQQLGRAEGAGGQALGLAGIISASLFGAAAFGGGPVGIAVGGIIASVGLVSAAMSASGAAAEEAAERVQAYVDILREVESIAEATPDIAERLTSIFAAQSEGIQEFLVGAGVSAQDLARLFSDGALTAAESLDLLGRKLNIDFDPLLEAAGGVDASFKDVIDSGFFLGEAFDGLDTKLSDAGFSLNDLLDLFAILDREAEALGGSVSQVDFERDFNEEPILASTKAMDTINGAIAKAIENNNKYGTSASNTGQQASEAWDSVTEAFAGIFPEIDPIQRALDSLDDQRLTGIQEQISTLGGELSNAREAADLARTSLTDYLTGDYADTALADVDRLIGQVGSVGSTIEEALALGGQRGTSAVNAALGDFDQSIARVISQGFADGLRTPEEFNALLAPFYAAISEEVAEAGQRGGEGIAEDLGVTSAAADLMRSSLDRALNDEALTAGVEFVTDAEAEVQRIQDELAGLSAELQVDVVFSVDQVRQALSELGLGDIVVSDLDVRNRQPQQVTSFPGSDRIPREDLVLAQAGARNLTSPITVVQTESFRADTDRTPKTLIQVEQNIYGQSDPQSTARRSVTELSIAAGGGNVLRSGSLS